LATSSIMEDVLQPVLTVIYPTTLEGVLIVMEFVRDGVTFLILIG